MPSGGVAWPRTEAPSQQATHGPLGLLSLSPPSLPFPSSLLPLFQIWTDFHTTERAQSASKGATFPPGNPSRISPPVGWRGGCSPGCSWTPRRQTAAALTGTGQGGPGCWAWALGLSAGLERMAAASARGLLSEASCQRVPASLNTSSWLHLCSCWDEWLSSFSKLSLSEMQQ